MKRISYEKGRFFINVDGGAVSLGCFIFWSDKITPAFNLDDNKKHEYGHSIQSRIFGPVYLIFVGMPSVMRVLYARYYFSTNKKRWENYFCGYPENWADRLGKVRPKKDTAGVP